MKNDKSIAGNILSWAAAVIIITIGTMNLFWVHPVPGMVYLLLSLIYLPPANEFLENRFSFRIPPAVKIILGVIIIMFTLGVSDLGDMFDDKLSEYL